MELPYTSSEQHLWWQQKPEEAAKNLMNLAEAGDNDNLPRRASAAYNASILEGIGVDGFGAWAYGKGTRMGAQIGPKGSSCPLVWNYPAAALDTLQSKVVGRTEPKPMIMVTDGDWDDQRRAVWSSRLLEGLYRQQQGWYHDVWDMVRQCFKIAAGVTGSVAVKVLPYPDESKIICELHDTLDMFIDFFECNYSNPLTYGETTWFDPHRLMQAFPKKKAEIWDAREPLPEDRGGGTGERCRYMVRLVEGWRLKLGKEPGRYVAAMKNGVLDSKKYEHESPPFAFLHARRSMGGFYGIPVMQRGMAIAERINQILHSLDKGERFMPRSAVIYDTVATPIELIKNVRDVMQIGYNSGAGGNPPQYETPAIYDQSVMNLLEAHIRAFHETLGINSGQMTAQKDPGIVAAAAVRTVNDMFTELFSVISRDVTTFTTRDLGQLHLRAVSDLVKTNPDFAVDWNGGTFIRKVKSSVCDMKGKSFTFSVETVSETRNTPGDRISMADEMLSRKELSPQSYQRVIATGDLPRETKAQRTQHSMIEQAIDSWMHDEIEEISNISPLPWMNQAEAIVQVLDGYMQALMMPKFDVRRELYFRRYIAQCDQNMKRREVELAKLQATAQSRAPVPGVEPAPPQPIV